ncbi:hypothetical protein HDU98_000681 [Podochytrium sp. JEL0797]|nr:hypothetical protein HDU98_000681 [Podochytrium sp. JEL0797]
MEHRRHSSMDAEYTSAASLRSHLRKSESRIKELDVAHFKSYINMLLSESSNDLIAAGILPIPSEPHNSIFDKCRDGQLLARLVNYAFPGAVDEKRLNKKARVVWQQAENLKVVLEAAAEAGIQVPNIDPMDILDGNTTALLGLIWQVVKVCQTVDSRDLQERLEIALKTIKERDIEIVGHKETIATLQTTAHSLESQHAVLVGDVKQLNLKLSTAETAPRDAPDAVACSDPSHLTYKADFQALETTLASTKAENATLLDRINTLTSKITGLETSHECESAAQQRVIETQQQSIEASVAQLRQHQQVQESISHTVSSLKSQLVKRESEMDVNRAQISKRDADLELLRSNLETAQRQLSSKQLIEPTTSVYQMDTSVNVEKQHLEELELRYNEILTTNAELGSRLVAAETCVSELKQKLVEEKEKQASCCLPKNASNSFGSVKSMSGSEFGDSNFLYNLE